MFGRALKAAWPLTIPVLTGYLVLGAAYGVLMDSIGYGLGWTFLASLTTYAGSMQFVAVSLLAAGFNPVNTAVMTLMVNARHIFYGLSMLGRFEGMGRAKAYLIFGLTDETFSVLSAHEAPEGIDKRSFVLAVTLLDHFYWVSGGVIGSLLGGALEISTQGLEFVLTALFTVIFLDQWRVVANRLPALMGIIASLMALWVFGPSNFIIPTLLIILGSVAAGRKLLDRKAVELL
ncbi:MAG: AzlC family ABC transporter permease [Eubacteriales bacterium]|nr:AzlC family ABC transporter permease [Eubacteriales bacterium]MDD3196753.1 AzlC family ABC transporter permease [Eubacteriales bacterium]MDD4682070.1 AzlC family ABC transporter permease [Eubacteriales bacterium]